MATINTIYQDDGTTINTIYDVQIISTEAAKETLTISASGSLAIAAGTLIDKIILEGSTGAFTIGTSDGGDEIDSGTITAGTPYILTDDTYFASAGTLYFTGTYTAKVYLR